jgi:hypothetical protein
MIGQVRATYLDMAHLDYSIDNIKPPRAVLAIQRGLEIPQKNLF